jgi:hypothetical protein
MPRIENSPYDPFNVNREANVVKPIQKVSGADLEFHKKQIEESVGKPEETEEQKLRRQMEHLDTELGILKLKGQAFEENRAAYQKLKDQLPK